MESLKAHKISYRESYYHNIRNSNLFFMSPKTVKNVKSN